MTKLETLNELLTTCLRIGNEGLEERLDMSWWYDDGSEDNEGYCGTTCCLAGWVGYFRFGPKATCDQASDIADETTKIVCGREPTYKHSVYGLTESVLFGGGRGSGPIALARQIRAVRWFINREEKLIEYTRIRSLPRKERRRLGIAA